MKRGLAEKEMAEIIQLKNDWIGTIEGIRIGKIISIKKGNIFVDYQDNPLGYIRARSIANVKFTDEDRDVLLMFEKNDPRFPIILGIVHDQAIIKEDTKEVFVDGEKIVFDAEKEIELRCGKGTLTIKKDGKIIIKGTQIVSRANKVNKIKGASVQIN